jgi:hypothetical protein
MTSDTIVLKNASLSIGNAITGTPLIYTILKSYSKEILKFISD